MKTCSNIAATNSCFCRLNRIRATVSAIAFAVLLLQPTHSSATLPPGEDTAVEWPDDLVEGWIGETASELMPDLIGRTFRPLTKEGKYDFINDALESSQHTVVWQEQNRTEHGTIAIPRLEGGFARTLEPDASLTLRFDKPVGQIRVGCQAQFSVKADRTHQVFRLEARNYEQGRIYPVQIRWRTTTGEPLPPLNLQLTTPPPLFVSVNTEGLTNLGLVLPIRMTFSEPLAENEKALQQIKVNTSEGQEVAGTWRWVGKRSLQFTPRPEWPASSLIQIRVGATELRTVQGGWMNQPFLSNFTTGTDRRIFVYLDTQQVTAVENGQPVQTFKVSTGKEKTPTAEGNFYIYDRYRHRTMRSRGLRKGQRGYYLVEDVPYTQFFNGDMAFHGAFWHNSFGQPASHGCVNMATQEMNKRWPNVAEDAGWLYQWASLGVPVTVLKSSPVEMAVK